MSSSAMPPVTQQFASYSSSGSSSSQFLSSALHAGEQARTGYPREGSLRGSASLQDLSAYRNGCLSNGVPISASLVGGFGSSLPGQQGRRNDSGPASLIAIKSNLLRRSSGSVSSPCHHSALCTRGRINLALTVLVGTLILVGVLWGRYGRLQDHLEYAVVIDCGSTGTRVHVYGWEQDGTKSLPVMVNPSRGRNIDLQRNDGAPTFDKGQKQGDSRLYKRTETEPGLDKLLHNESGVAYAIEPLILWATKEIPEAAQRKTKLFFLATAGLRRLSVIDSQWLLDKAWFSLLRSPFLCKRQWVRVISGQEEAYYGWIALNYNMNRFGYHSDQPTLGALDLGGSSLEVTFELSEKIPNSEYLVNVSVGLAAHHLYAHSHVGFGLNDAFEMSIALLIERGSVSEKESGKDVRRVSHPCLNSGYNQLYVCSSHCLLTSLAEPQQGPPSVLAARELGPNVELIGKPNWALCQSLVESIINTSRSLQKSEGKGCQNSPCALGEYQPQLRGQFFALAGFFVVFKFFGLSSTNSLDDLLHEGQQFCALEWEEAQQSVASQPSINQYCFRAPYVVALLRQGLHLSDEQVTIGSGDFAWTLGAALNEAGALLPQSLRREQGGSATSGLRYPGFPLHVQSFTFLFVAICLAILLLIVFGRWISSHAWHQSYLPLFLPPFVSSGPLPWCAPTFRSSWRLGTSAVATASQPGEIRVKQPHSPFPSGSKAFHHQMFESGDMHAGGDGPVLECDVLQHPSSSGTSCSGGRSQIQLATHKMQQKGRSQLQSRRSQSREDLSTYVSPDNQHISKVKLTRELSPVRIFTPLRHDFSV